MSKIGLDPSVRSLVRRVRVATKHSEAVLKRFGQWFSAASQGVQLCALILGDTGVGKTVLARTICETYKSTRKSEGLHTPVLFVQTPESPSSIALLEAMLESLGDPMPGAGNKRSKLRRLLKALKDQKVVIVLLDDIQQLVDSNREWLIYDASEGLKTILKMSSVSIVGLGLGEATLLVKLNEQWERLNQGLVILPRLQWNDEPSRLQLRAVLKFFQSRLPMFSFPDLASERMALRFYLASGGLIDYVAKILMQATWDAMDQGRTTITTDHLHEAWKAAICLVEELGYEPFKMTIKQGQEPAKEIARAQLIVKHKDKVLPASRPPRPTKKPTTRDYLAEIGLK